jgi:hypothetical protein
VLRNKWEQKEIKMSNDPAINNEKFLVIKKGVKEPSSLFLERQ